MTRAPKKTRPADPKREFRGLLRASGWSQAEAARQLAMSPSALSQIVRRNSPVRPSPVTLRLFRLLLLREGPERPGAGRATPPGGRPWERDVLLALRKIAPETRQPILDALRAMMAAAQKSAREARRSTQSGGPRPENG